MAVLPTRPRRDRSPARRAALLSLVPLGLLGGYIGGRRLRKPPPPRLEPPLTGEMVPITIPFGQLMSYQGGVAHGAPLLLVHSVNAAASAYEVKPLYDHYAGTRAVYAFDLPGFGFSDRRDRIYTPQLMTEAVMAMVEAIRAKHGPFPIDAIAVSTASEFLVRAASEHPMVFRSIALISPTGLQSKRPGDGAPGSTLGMPSVRDLVSFPLWARSLFDVLVSRTSIRLFLNKTWGSTAIDEGLFAYDYATAHQPGAEYAPFSFISGFLSSADMMTLYRSLSLPVWMCHGVRGDFVDYDRKVEVEGRPNWTIQVFQTGAMGHFERLGEVTEAYDAFLDRVA